MAHILSYAFTCTNALSKITNRLMPRLRAICTFIQNTSKHLIGPSYRNGTWQQLCWGHTTCLSLRLGYKSAVVKNKKPANVLKSNSLEYSQAKVKTCRNWNRNISSTGSNQSDYIECICIATDSENINIWKTFYDFLFSFHMVKVYN